MSARPLSPRLILAGCFLTALAAAIVLADSGQRTMPRIAADSTEELTPSASSPGPQAAGEAGPQGTATLRQLGQKVESGLFIESSKASKEDLQALLDGLQGAISSELVNQDPIVVMLHGPDANAFVRQNYSSNKMLVDQAALLDSYGLIDVQMCATWLDSVGLDDDDLPAYIQTVPYWRDEIDRLSERGYSRYGSVDL